MNSRPPSSSAASVITPARCGSKTSRLIPCWHDKHVLTCEWAKAQGIEVKDRGRVSAELVVKFKAATGQ
jgi:hypothetical protein